jgi:hypothetical protein
MAISAVSGSTNLDNSLTAQAALKTAVPPKPAGGSGKPSGASAPASASSASGTSSASSNNKIYDKRDTNKDGTVSYEEAMQYAFKHADEAASSQTATPTYTQQGKATNAATGATNTISLSA